MTMCDIEMRDLLSLANNSSDDNKSGIEFFLNAVISTDYTALIQEELKSIETIDLRKFLECEPKTIKHLLDAIENVLDSERDIHVLGQHSLPDVSYFSIDTPDEIIPKEIIVKILQSLSITELATISQSDQSFYKYARQELITRYRKLRHEIESQGIPFVDSKNINDFKNVNFLSVFKKVYQRQSGSHIFSIDRKKRELVAQAYSDVETILSFEYFSEIVNNQKRNVNFNSIMERQAAIDKRNDNILREKVLDENGKISTTYCQNSAHGGYLLELEGLNLTQITPKILELISGIDKITSVDLNSNALSYLPVGLFKIPSLQENLTIFILSDNSIYELPSELSLFTNLECFNGDKVLDYIPEAFVHLKKLSFIGYSAIDFLSSNFRAPANLPSNVLEAIAEGFQVDYYGEHTTDEDLNLIMKDEFKLYRDEWEKEKKNIQHAMQADIGDFILNRGGSLPELEHNFDKAIILDELAGSLGTLQKNRIEELEPIISVGRYWTPSRQPTLTTNRKIELALDVSFESESESESDNEPPFKKSKLS